MHDNIARFLCGAETKNATKKPNKNENGFLGFEGRAFVQNAKDRQGHKMRVECVLRISIKSRLMDESVVRDRNNSAVTD